MQHPAAASLQCQSASSIAGDQFKMYHSAESEEASPIIKWSIHCQCRPEGMFCDWLFVWKQSSTKQKSWSLHMKGCFNTVPHSLSVLQSTHGNSAKYPISVRYPLDLAKLDRYVFRMMKLKMAEFHVWSVFYCAHWLIVILTYWDNNIQ